MSTLAESLRASTTLEDHEIEWVHLVVGDWQLLADLSFADLVLWVPSGVDGWLAVAHVRPNTGPMVFYDDVVGRTSGRWRDPILDEAYRQRRIVSGRQNAGQGELAVREQAIPVVKQGRSLAVITRHTNVVTGRTPSRLELTYRHLAEALTRMIAAGEFPSTAAPTGARRGAPRVGDGVVHLDPEGAVLYASPNAISAIHRLGHRGDVIGEVLATVVTELLQSAGTAVDESLAVVITGRAPWWTEVSTASASVTLRAIPLTNGGSRDGAMLLLRDVSELR
ncbi:MAG: histidine kinase N-terminal domain-containing protein, partial [Knoellia sp.]